MKLADLGLVVDAGPGLECGLLAVVGDRLDVDLLAWLDGREAADRESLAARQAQRLAPVPNSEAPVPNTEPEPLADVRPGLFIRLWLDEVGPHFGCRYVS